MTQPYYPAPTASQLEVLLRPARKSALAITTMVVLGLIGIGVTVLLVLSASPLPVVIAAFAAALTFPLLIALCFWLDRYEPEPARYRMAALVWGGTAAVVIGAGLSLLLSYLVSDSEAVAAVFWAPLTEEFGKALFLILLVVLRPQQLHGPLDGAIYAALVGIGFSFVEDTLYYSMSLVTGGPESLVTLVFLRGVLGPFSHSLYTALFGIGLGFAVQTRSRVVKVLAPVGGYLGAVFMHALWNGSVTFYALSGFLLAYVFVVLPAIGVAVALGVWARTSEGMAIRRSLTECAQFGFVDPREIGLVANMANRVRARRVARQVGGRPAARAMDAFQSTLTEMAFLHSSVRRGTARPDAVQRMAALNARAAALRPYVLPVAALSGPAQPTSGR